MASEPGGEPIAEVIRRIIAGTNGHVVFAAAEVAELLAEHDALAAHADQIALDVSDQSKRARAAEAVVEQVQALVDTWRKMAGPPEERADDAATMLRRVIASLSDVLPAGPTPLVCGCGIAPDGAPGWGGGCSPGCMEPAPTAGLDFRVMPPEIPLSAIPGMEDGQSITVAALLYAVQRRRNNAGAEYALLTLADDTGDVLWGSVRTSPEAWQQYQHHLTEGARAVLTIAASRDWAGLDLWLTAAATLDWDTIPVADLTEDGAA